MQASTYFGCLHISLGQIVYRSIKVDWYAPISFLILDRFFINTGELGYDGPLYDRFLHMTDDMLGPSLMHIKYSSYVYEGFCIWRTNFPGPIESVISKFTCTKFEPFLLEEWLHKCWYTITYTRFLWDYFSYLFTCTNSLSLCLQWMCTILMAKIRKAVQITKNSQLIILRQFTNSLVVKELWKWFLLARHNFWHNISVCLPNDLSVCKDYGPPQVGMSSIFD